MGCYVNPENESKEEFLVREGRQIKATDAVITNEEYPVCLITPDRGTYTAAAIAYNEKSLKLLTDPLDIRSKAWFMVKKSALVKVSDIEGYLDEDQ